MLLEGKKAAIFGVANQRSIAYGISSAFKREGAELCFSYLGDALKKRVEPISEELGGAFTFPCDVSSDDDIARAAELVAEKWGKLDILVHSVAFANRDDLTGRFIDTSRDGFRLAMRKEDIVVLETAMRLRDVLVAQGATVVLTREVQDIFHTNIERCDIAAEAGAHVMLRLHCNNTSNKNKTGIQIVIIGIAFHQTAIPQMQLDILTKGFCLKDPVHTIAAGVVFYVDVPVCQ